MIDELTDVDLFAGGGGFSMGHARAIQRLPVKKLNLVAVNHWPTAIQTHQANFPWAKHLQSDVEAVNPLEAVPSGHVHLLTASPECIHFSRAAGGRPKNEQKRSHAWAILRWLEMLQVDAFIIENVEEFRKWGPLDEKGYPIKALEGTIFNAFIKALRCHGYTVEYHVLNSADYGAVTSRRRLFICGLKGKRHPAWPQPTHSKTGGQGTLDGEPLKKWRSAREIIDFDDLGESIFNRKKPPAVNTLLRIIEGLHRFSPPEAAPFIPFIVNMEHGGKVDSVDSPLRTITTAKGGASALVTCRCFILSQASGGAPRATDEPIPTITGAGAHALIQPVLVAMENVNRLGPTSKSVDDSLWTITGEGRIGLAQASFITPNHGEDKGQALRIHSLENPLPTVTSHGAGNLIQAILLPNEGFYHKEGQNKAFPAEEPLKTITSRGGGSVILVKYYNHGGVQSVDVPLATVTAKDRFALVSAFLLQMNGTADSQIKNSAHSVDEPLGTLTGSEHFALVQPVIDGISLDIRLRMLRVRELKLATGFSEDYKILGSQKDAVKQIGNAVVVPMAEALIYAMLKKSLGVNA